MENFYPPGWADAPSPAVPEEPPLRAQLAELDSELLLLDPAEQFDACILGIGSRCGSPDVIVYSVEAILDALVADGMTEEDAEEHFGFNIEGAYVGERTPIYVRGLP